MFLSLSGASGKPITLTSIGAQFLVRNWQIIVVLSMAVVSALKLNVLQSISSFTVVDETEVQTFHL